MIPARMLTLLVLGMASPSAAYVDPGTAGSLFQLFYLLLLGAVAFVGRPFRALFEKLGWRKPKEAEEEESDVDEADSEQ